jgi:WD40 repeat protein
MSRCPTPAELEQLLEEELSDSRQRAVSAHVGACARCRAALERMTEQTCRLGGRHPPPPESADVLDRLKQAPPSTALFGGGTLNRAAGGERPPAVDGYEVLGELGRGGMGVVYKARQLKLDRVAALKMILAGAHAGPKDLARFRQEAEAVARLHHPNIVQIYDVGESEGRPYIALEFVEHGSLARRLRGDPQPLQEAAGLIETLARAVHFAHLHHVVHRDLKPANILLSRQKAEGRRQNESQEDSSSFCLLPSAFCLPKITDFGLAKRLDTQGGTHSGEVLGTPSYMAPEQAGGKAERVGPAADVYALGAILYELLTGRPPFKAATALDTVLQVLHEEPVRPGRLRPQLPRDLETICLKCLEKEPARRYASAEALAEDLRRFLRQEPIRARPVGAQERAWKWARRRPLSAALLAGIVLVTVLGFAGVTWQWQEARLLRDAALAEEHDKEEQRQHAEEARDRAEHAQLKEAAERRRAVYALYYSRIAQSQLQWRVNDLPGALRSLSLYVPADGQRDRRGWEWHYLDDLYHAELFTFQHRRNGLEGAVAVAYRPDGGAVASVVGGSPPGSDNRPAEFRLWDTTTGGVLLERPLPIQCHRLAFRPDGGRVALAADGTVLLWDAAGRPVRTWRPHDQRVNALAFSPDGGRLATAAADRTVKVSDADSGALLHTLPHGGPVYGLAFHHDGRLLATGSEDTTDPTPTALRGMVRIWDGRRGALLQTWAAHKTAVHCVAFSPDGQQLVSASANGNLKVWDVASGKATRTWSGQTGAILALAFSPTGRYLAYSGTDKTVRVWDVEAGAERFLFRGHSAVVDGVQFSPDARRLVSSSPGQVHAEVKVWDLTRHPEHATLARTATDVEGVAFDEDGARLVSVTRAGKLQRWDAASGMLEAEHDLETSGEPVSPAGVLAAFGPGGRRLAARCREDRRLVRVWDADGGAALFVCRGHTLPVFCLRFSPDGGPGGVTPPLLATCACDRQQAGRPHEVKVWDAATGAPRAALAGGGLLFNVAFSPDGRWLAVAGADGVAVHDWSAGRVLVRLGGHRSEVTAVAFSPDGRRLASAGIDDGLVHVWDCTRWGGGGRPQPLHTLAAPALVCDLAFSPDGKRLAAAARDQVQMWDAETAEEVLTLRGAPQRHRDPPFNPRLAFSPDGRRLAGTNWNESISVWDAPLLDDRDPTARNRRQEARRLAAAQRALFWHVQEAEHCLEHRNAAAARFHLGRLGDAPLPPPVQARKERLLRQLAEVNAPAG